MKKILGQLVCVTMIVILTGTLLWAASRFFEYKQSRAKYDDFFASSETIDIWFFGTSHTVMADLPMELWDEYHLTSYNFANYGQWMPVNYWLLRLALEYQTPKLVVIDTYNFTNNDKYSEDHLSSLHEALDAFPYSALKKQAVTDLFPPERARDYLYPFSVNHSQWNVVTQENFQAGKEVYTYGNGSDENALNAKEMKTLVQPQKDRGPVDLQEKGETASVGKDYLLKMIELCREKGIDVLLTTIPYLPVAKQVRSNNALGELATAYGVLFDNGLAENDLDLKTDFWDDGHLNSSGARKWTHSLGEFIATHYEIPARTDADLVAAWSAAYENYMDYKIAAAAGRDAIADYLMLIADRHLSACIYIENVKAYEQIEELVALMENFAGQELTKLRVSAQTGGKYLLIVSKLDGEVIEVNVGEPYQKHFSFGDLNYAPNSLIISTSTNFLITEKDDKAVPYMQVVLINDITHRAVDVARFTLSDGHQETTREE